MKAGLIAILVALGTAACADGPAPDGGIANYDALKLAQTDCAARGGKLVLKTDGDPQSIDAWTCKRN